MRRTVNRTNPIHVQKTMLILTFIDFKKKSIPPREVEVAHDSTHLINRDPSLGSVIVSFMVITNIDSARSEYGAKVRQPKLHVMARNSCLRARGVTMKTIHFC